ncbi:MAG: type II secretion system protein [Deltaproteobacteria bacterium]
MSARRPGISKGEAAFTLLEVMVAVAILGLGLTTILTAQTGLFSSAKRAAQLSQAVGLARCKMSEIEVQLLKEGYSITADNEEGECCEDEDSKDLRCKWTIAPVMLPELAMGGGADAGAGEGEGSGSSMENINSTIEQATTATGQGDPASAFSALGSMGATSGAGPSMGGGALASMALGMVYPQLKGMLEASIRKVTVQVLWKDGASERDLTVTQYLTNPQAGGLLSVDESGAGGSGGASGGAAGTRGSRP